MPRSDYVKLWGVYWPVVKDPASIHLDCIAHGGEWINSQTGETCGGGMEFHYKELIKILWPEVVMHRWLELILKNYLTHRLIVLIGPASSSKTFSSALLVLIDYFAHPDCTTVICCSTTKERLQERVWADVTKLFKNARKRAPWLPGNIIEGRLRIVTDSRKDSPDGRDFRNGCVGVPCKRGENFVGLSDFAGIKNKRVRLLGDELSLLPRAFCDAISNLDKNPDFKCIGLGNPKDTTDALGVLGEPAASLGGWESGIDQTFGTKTWEVRRSGGVCIQLPGDDSPNLDGSLGIPLISQADIDRDVSFYGKDSVWFTMMDLGKMPRGAGSRRVLTRQLCENFRALEEPMWRDSNLRRIAFMDAGYGGDRCIFGELVFGYESVHHKSSVPDASGIAASQQFNSSPHQIIALVDTMVVPMNPGLDVELEDQIATFVMKQCEARGIPAENFFFESGMRTQLVTSFGRIWSPQVESVDCMGSATESPVSANIPKLCKDYYANKITEIWYGVRLTVEAAQFRGMKESAMMEFCDREWTIVAGNKIQVEPKDKMKLKTGRSPDEADAVAIGLFGAQRRGFRIARLQPDKPLNRVPDWRDTLRDKSKKIWESGQLEYATTA